MKLISPLIFACLCFALFGCDKQKIEADNLTACPADGTCAYQYFDNRTLDSGLVRTGTMRVFRYTWTMDNGVTANMRELVFSAPLSDNRFEVGNAEIASRQLIYRIICPACNTIPVEAKTGKIRGQKADGSRWLIEATVYLGADVHGTPYSDTLHIKQYFIPGEVN